MPSLVEGLHFLLLHISEIKQIKVCVRLFSNNASFFVQTNILISDLA